MNSSIMIWSNAKRKIYFIIKLKNLTWTDFQYSILVYIVFIINLDFLLGLHTFGPWWDFNRRRKGA